MHISRNTHSSIDLDEDVEFASDSVTMAAVMQLTSSLALPATGINAVSRLASNGTSRVTPAAANTRIPMRPLVAVRASGTPASGGTTDKAGYAQTNAGGSGAENPSSFANDVVEGAKDKVADAQKSAANLGAETQENLKNVGQETKEGIADVVDSSKEVVDRAVSSNPGH